MSEEKQNPLILGIALEQSVADFLKSTWPQAQFLFLAGDKAESLIDEPPNPSPNVAICGKEVAGISPQELAQLFRTQFQETPVYYVTELPGAHKKDELLKNGFHDVFVLNIDRQLFREAIDVALSKKGKVRAYRSVRMLDIDPSSNLGFDISIFLALNNKYVRFCSADDQLGEERFKKLASKNINSLHVAHEDLPKFYKHAADYLKKIGSDQKMSETEKQEKMKSAVRNMLGDLLSESEHEGNIGTGKVILADCQNIVKTYIASSDESEWYKKILAVMDDTANSYTHAGRVATFAAMFSLGLGIGKSAELAAAGLLHDVGLSLVPEEIRNKPESARTKEEQAKYEKHVEDGLEIIRTKKLILPETILKAIAQHHENFNGTGYPKKIAGARISKEAQLLHLADEFDELTTVQPGQKRLTPREAIGEIQKRSQGPQQHFDPELVKKLASLFDISSAS